jgi:hypothetical protein
MALSGDSRTELHHKPLPGLSNAWSSGLVEVRGVVYRHGLPVKAGSIADGDDSGCEVDY